MATSWNMLFLTVSRVRAVNSNNTVRDQHSVPCAAVWCGVVRAAPFRHSECTTPHYTAPPHHRAWCNLLSRLMITESWLALRSRRASLRTAPR